MIPIPSFSIPQVPSQEAGAVMTCVLLCAPGETLEGRDELQTLGFDTRAYPVSQEVDLLRDSRDAELVEFMGGAIDSLDKPGVRSLRVSFAKMLLDPAFECDDCVIFGESDATPVVEASTLRPVMEAELRSHPEADVFRLYLEVADQPSRPPDHPDHLRFETWQPTPHTLNGAFVWGTHALVIPARSRRKVAEIFLNWRLPIDNALEAASAERLITVRYCRHNLFYQKPRTTRADISSMYSWRKRKMALCLASYKRPVDLQRQIYAMMQQSYDADSYHLFVAVKGVSEFLLHSFIIPQFQQYIDVGRLTIRHFPNSNQLTNLLDCTRGMDTSDYELFLKIDDDDFYSPDYLRLINEFYTIIPQHHSCFFSDMTWMLHQYGGLCTPTRQMFYVCGPSLVMSRAVMELVRRSEREPEIIREAMAWGGGQAHSCIAYMEDNFIHRLMRIHGCSNIAPFLADRGIRNFILYQDCNPSVMRGGLVAPDMAAHRDVAKSDAPSEDVFFLQHPQWSDSIRLFGRMASRLSNGDRASLLSQSAAVLTLKWEGGGVESFRRQADGSYVYDASICTSQPS